MHRPVSHDAPKRSTSELPDRRPRSAEGPHGRRPKLLFLTYHFPPYNTIASVRTGAIAKHMSLLGWDVTVVAPHYSYFGELNDPVSIAEEMDAAGVRRVYTGHRWACLSTIHLRPPGGGLKGFFARVVRRIGYSLRIDECTGWYSEARRACGSMQPADVDVILATGKPFGTFSVARWLGRRLKRPYVLDYRDLWTGQQRRRPPKPRRIRAERRVLADCAAVTAVSPSMAAVLDEQFAVGDKTHVIFNGYDPFQLDSVVPYAFDHRAIVYAGIFYPPRRVITPVMAALRELEQRYPEDGGLPPWRFHYYGPASEHVRAEAERFGVLSHVVLHGTVPRDEALSALRGACAAIVITSVEDRATTAVRGIVTGKVFEAIGLGSPVLVVAPPGSDVEAVMERAGRGRVFPGSETGAMAAYLQELILGRAPGPNNPEAFAWPNLIRQLDGVMREATCRT